jgi:chromate transport protein ChrA
MRPQSIVRFERVVLLTILIGLVTIVISWETAFAPVRRHGLGEGFFWGVSAASVAIVVALLWLIARRASSVAKWIYVALSAVGIVMAVLGVSETLRLPPAILLLELVQWLLTLYSVWLLFRPDSNAWFERGGGSADGRVA